MSESAPAGGHLGSMAERFTPELRRQLSRTSDTALDDKSKLLALARSVLVACDDVDEEVKSAVDYLHCQVEHRQNQDRVLEAIQYRGRVDGEFAEVRHLLREASHGLMSSIRYGKRPPELDELLLRITNVTEMMHHAPIGPPISLANVDSLTSPWCKTCPEACRSAHRKVQVFLRRLRASCSELVKPADESDSGSKSS